MRRKRMFRRTVWSLLCLGLLLMALPGRFAYSQSAPRDQAEAWNWIQKTWLKTAKKKDVSDLKMENGVISGETKNGGTFRIVLALTNSVTRVRQRVTATYSSYTVQWYEFPNVSSSIGAIQWHSFNRYRSDDAQTVQAALTYLAHAAQEEQAAKDAADLESFQPKAEAWRQLAAKPAMPEEAQRHQVLAEYAFKNKDVPKAITEYDAALKIFPCWPDGQSNLANLAAEVGTRPGYNMAIYHMKLYLALVPNAPDAKAAQDSIFIWEDKRTTATP